LHFVDEVREIDAWAGRFSPRVLERGDVLEL